MYLSIQQKIPLTNELWELFNNLWDRIQFFLNWVTTEAITIEGMAEPIKVYDILFLSGFTVMLLVWIIYSFVP